MLSGLSLAHSNGFSPPIKPRRECQSQRNPLQLTLVDSSIYPQNQERQTHCGYLLLFQQVNPREWPVFRKEIAVQAFGAVPVVSCQPVRGLAVASCVVECGTFG